MLQRHPTEVGICIDHNAAFFIENNEFRVIYPEGLEGSLMEDGSFSGDRLGKPAVWIKELDDEKTMTCRLCPDSGKLKQLLKMPVDITQSIRNMKIAEKENPDNGPMRKSYPGFTAKSFFGGNIVRDFVQFFEGEDFDEGDDDSEQ